MSSIVQQIEKDFIESYKAKDETRISVLRMLKAAIKNSQIEKGDQFCDDLVYKIISKEIKQRRESAELYQKGGREDLANKELLEIKVIEKYLPLQLNKEDIISILKSVIAENNLSGTSDFGKSMKLAMAKFSGRADGALVSSILKSLLSK